MNNQSNLYITPEAQLADRFLLCIPRAEKIDEAELKHIVNWNDSHDKDLYDKYHVIALDILINEGYLTKHPGVGINNRSTQYSLTHAGRKLKDEGGYVLALRKKNEKESFSNKINNAEGKKKIFDNKFKFFLLLLACIAPLIGVISFWKKYSSTSDILQSQSQSLPTVDTTSKYIQTPQKPYIKKAGRSENHLNQIPEQSTPLQATLQSDKHVEAPVNMPTVTNEPIQTTTSDNIEFKLMKAEGNSKAQSIKLTMVLTTSAANWYIMSAVKSIIDPEGNEYRLKSFTIGASDYITSIDLKTGVPIKCTYTFGGVLPDVKKIKLFNYSYTHSWGEPFAVEFRDIPVDWK
ncbi:hypothetical protein SAMN04488505_103113 [Chitinophaga rupis]|uniref:Uncharacterized protein n=1 Tax=Chitinophaga rupis TaxID=573321 RepID=A0A1H7UVW3_9BACT|nr:hypothetical protein [Chitinophaga rupis]SEM00617.1 hypothetical protein SAMN04488505_103113 [Chitinophaga rupis]